MQTNLQQDFGNIDIYLFDQLLKGTYDNCRKVLDAGCGGGRNLWYFLKNDYEVYGIDPNAEAIEAVKTLAKDIAPKKTHQSILKLQELKNYPLMINTLIW